MMAADVLVLGAGLAASRPRATSRRAAPTCSCSRRATASAGAWSSRAHDGRVLQLGGEVVGSFHTAYLALAAELGLATEPSYVAEPGALSWWLPEGGRPGRLPARLHATPTSRRAERIEAALVALARDRRPGRSVGASGRRGARRDLRRGLDARAGRAARGAADARAVRALDGRRLGGAPLAARRAAPGRRRRARRSSTAASAGRACGSPPAARRSRCAMGEELGDRVRLGAVVTRARRRAAAASTATLRDGEALRGGGRGLRAARRAAARHRDHRRLRRAAGVAAPPAPGARGEGRRGLPGAGLARRGRQRARAGRGHRRLELAAGQRTRSRCSSGPERLGVFLSAPPAVRRAEVLALLADLYGAGGARSPMRLRRARTGASTRSRRATSPSGRRAT